MLFSQQASNNSLPTQVPPRNITR